MTKENPLKLVFLMMSTLCLMPTYGQHSWIKTYGGNEWDNGHWVRQTRDGGYIITGRTMSYGAGGEDLYLIRLDADGDTIWTKTYGGVDSDGGTCVQITSDEGFIIVGRTWSFGAGHLDVWLLKTDSLGDTLWTKTFGGPYEDWGYCVRTTIDNGYIVTGYTHSFGSGGDVWLIKTDSLGNSVWSRTYGGSNYDEARSVLQTADRGFIIVGTYNFNTSNSSLYIIKSDSLGNESWTKFYGDNGMDYGLNVEYDLDEGYVIVGKKTLPGVAGQAYLIRTDVDGDTLWTKTYGGTADDYAASVQTTLDSGYILAGALGPEQRAYLIKTNRDGDSIWSKVYGTGGDNFFSVQQTIDLGYIGVGSTFSIGQGGYDVFAVKTDEEGNVELKEERSEGKKQNARLVVAPNPFVSYTIVPGNETERFLVYDISGRLKGTYPGNYLGKGLEHGVYFFRPLNHIAKSLRILKIQ